MVVGAALQFWKCLYCSPLYFCCHRLFKFNKHCVVPTWVRISIFIRHMQSEVERACVTSRLIIGLTLSHNRHTAIVYAHLSYSDLSAIKGCWLVVIGKGGSSCWYQQGDHWPGHRSSPHPHRAGGQAAAGGTQQGEVIPYRDMHTDSQLGVRRKNARNISTSVSVGCHCTRGHLFLHHHYYLVFLFFSGPVATRQSQRQWGGLGTVLSIIINIK